jgi:hypothetical protein
MLNIIQLETKEGLENYEALCSGLAISEPYFLQAYVATFSNGLKNLICFSYQSNINNANVIMLGYLNSIVIGEEKIKYYDFITPYGYTGPFLSKNIVDSDIEMFWKLVDAWYDKNNVVTEFIRFNLFGNEKHYSGKIFTTMLNVKGKIIEEEEQWKSFDRKVRKNVNKAKRENLSSKVYFLNIAVEKITEFYDIYIQTMKRTNANVSFLYSFDEFKRFLSNNENHAAICTIYFENTPVSSELLLVSNNVIYSFLGGTNDIYFDKRPNDFLKVEALNWARTQGKKYYVLGGGYGFEDGIFKYKKAFFPKDVVNFYTGRKVLNEKKYNELVHIASNYRFAKGLDKLDMEDSTFFPLYNKTH